MPANSNHFKLLDQRIAAYSLSLCNLLGCDFIRLFAARLQVMASGHRAGLCGRVGVPERDLPVQSGHGQLLTVRTVSH